MRRLVASPTFSSISLDLYDDEFEHSSASAGARASSSAKVSILMDNFSGTASKTSHASATASPRFSKATALPTLVQPVKEAA